MAKRLADKEGRPKSAIVRKAVACYASVALGGSAAVGKRAAGKRHAVRLPWSEHPGLFIRGIG